MLLLGENFPIKYFCTDGEGMNLSKNNSSWVSIFSAQEGVAVHINAFNFPVGEWREKIAVNLLAGVPAIVKPATITSYLTEAVVKENHRIWYFTKMVRCN